MTVFGDGSQTRSFCYVDDLVRGLRAPRRVRRAPSGQPREPDEKTLLELAGLIIELTGSSSEIVFEALPVDDPQVRKPDITRAKQVLGWEPRWLSRTASQDDRLARPRGAVGSPCLVSDLGARYEEHHRERRDEGTSSSCPSGSRSSGRRSGRDGASSTSAAAPALTRHFLEGNSVVGLDVDRAALAKAAALGVEPVQANVEEPLPFEDASFDAVVAGELLEHLRFPETLVAEARRVSPGGVLVGSVPNAFRLQGRLRFARGRPPEDDPTHLHLFSPSSIRALLGAFERVEIAYVGGRYRGLHAVARPRRLLRPQAGVASPRPNAARRAMSASSTMCPSRAT